MVQDQPRKGYEAHRERQNETCRTTGNREDKTDGRWDAAYASQSKATVPEDLQRELDKNPEAAAFFETLESANRYAILYQIEDAKKPEARARRIEKYVTMLFRHEKIHS